MFDPIVGPPDQHSGPAVGHTTEKGDTWHGAVGKINAGFAKIKEALMGGAAVAVEAVDEDARKAFVALRSAHDQLVHNYNNLVPQVEALSAEIEQLKAEFAARVPAPGNTDASLDAVAAALSTGA